MSRFPGASAGLAGLGSFVEQTSPLRIAQTMQAFQRVQQNEQQRQIFDTLIRQHQSDFQRDPEYRRQFNLLARKDPNALQSAQNLSQIRGRVGMARETMKMVGELEKRVDAFAQSPQGQAIGFNAEFEMQELKRLGKLIQENPEVGNQALMQKMNVLSAAMQNGQREQTIQALFRNVEGRPLAEQFGILDQTKGIDLRDRIAIQNALAQRAGIGAGAQAKALEQQGTPGFNFFLGQLREVTDDPTLQTFKSNVTRAKQQNLITEDERKQLFSDVDSHLKQLTSAAEGAAQQINFAENVDALVERLGQLDFEASEAGLTSFLEDEENQKFFKQMTGFSSIGEARRGIQNFDAILRQRFLQAVDTNVGNQQLEGAFREAGGVTEVRGEAYAQPSSTIRGALVVPHEGTNFAPFNAVPPKGALRPGFISDDRGLVGVTGFNLVETTVPDEEGQPVSVMIPSFDAVQTRQTKGGDQLGFAFNDAASEPRVITIPVADGTLDQKQRRQVNLADYIREVVQQVDPDEEGGVFFSDRTDLTLKTAEDLQAAVAKEARKEKDARRKEQLELTAENLQNAIDSVTVVRQVGIPAPSSPAGAGTIPKRFTRSDQRGTVAEREMNIAAWTRIYTEYARFQAIMSNAFIDTEEAVEGGNP